MEFIECHERDTGTKMLVPLHRIRTISQNKDLTAFIETHIDFDGNSVGIYTKELYVELKRQILKSA